jgi:serine/threonine protein kinase
MIDTKQCDYAGDLWALGVIIYQAFTGQVPFKGKTQESTFDKIRKGLFEMPKTVPPLAQDLIRKLLTVNPELRLGAADMYDLMRHKFFDGIDFETIHDMEPPEKFHLTKMQSIMVKYLPHNVQETLRK